MDLFETIFKRHSVRRYGPDNLPDDVLHRILSAGCAAAVGRGNYAALHLTAVRTPEMMARMPSEPLYGASAFILLSAMMDVDSHDTNYANAGTIFASMMLAATALGVGSVYEWGPPQTIAQDAALCRSLGIPPAYTPISGLALGYPAETAPPKEPTLRIACTWA